jgi:hypothetical protein
MPTGFVKNTLFDKTRNVFAIFLSGAFAKLWKAIIRFIISFRPHGTTHLPQDGFS